MNRLILSFFFACAFTLSTFAVDTVGVDENGSVLPPRDSTKRFTLPAKADFSKTLNFVTPAALGGNSGVNDTSAVTAADTAAAAAGMTLRISKKFYVAGTVSIASRVEFENGGMLETASSATVNLNGGYSAPPTQIFGSNVTVKVAYWKNKEPLCFEHFGAVPLTDPRATSPDSTAACQKALNSISTYSGYTAPKYGTATFNAIGIYGTSDELTSVGTQLNVIGQASGWSLTASGFKWVGSPSTSNATKSVIKVTGALAPRFENLIFIGYPTVEDSKRLYAAVNFLADAATGNYPHRAYVKNCQVSDLVGFFATPPAISGTEGSITNGSPTMTNVNVDFTAGDYVGLPIRATVGPGDGIRSGTRILTVNSAHNITLSKNATATKTGTLTWNVPGYQFQHGFISGGDNGNNDFHTFENVQVGSCLNSFTIWQQQNFGWKFINCSSDEPRDSAIWNRRGGMFSIDGFYTERVNAPAVFMRFGDTGINSEVVRGTINKFAGENGAPAALMTVTGASWTIKLDFNNYWYAEPSGAATTMPIVHNTASANTQYQLTFEDSDFAGTFTTEGTGSNANRSTVNLIGCQNLDKIYGNVTVAAAAIGVNVFGCWRAENTSYGTTPQKPALNYRTVLNPGNAAGTVALSDPAISKNAGIENETLGLGETFAGITASLTNHTFKFVTTNETTNTLVGLIPANSRVMGVMAMNYNNNVLASNNTSSSALFIGDATDVRRFGIISNPTAQFQPSAELLTTPFFAPSAIDVTVTGAYYAPSVTFTHSGTTLTATGSAFQSDMSGKKFMYLDGPSAGQTLSISGYTSATVVTTSESNTMSTASHGYVIIPLAASKTIMLSPIYFSSYTNQATWTNTLTSAGNAIVAVDALTPATGDATALGVGSTILAFTNISGRATSAQLPLGAQIFDTQPVISLDADLRQIYDSEGTLTLDYTSPDQIEVYKTLHFNSGAAIANVGVNATGATVQTSTTSGANPGWVGGTIFTHYTDSSTTSTNGTEDNLYSDTFAVNTFSANGIAVDEVEHVTFVSSATASRRLKKYFGGTLIYDSGALTPGIGTFEIVLRTTIIRESSSVVRCSVAENSASAVLTAPSYTRITGLDFTATKILKTTGIASGTGAASGDIVNKLAKISWSPSP